MVARDSFSTCFSSARWLANRFITQIAARLSQAGADRAVSKFDAPALETAD
jgi:hypothetical protein